MVALCGVALAISPLAQSGWTRWHQAKLEREWQRDAAHSKFQATNSRAESSSIRFAIQTAPRKKTIQKWPPTRLLIPEIDLDAIVVQGENEASLRDGPGHDPFSALPGQNGNCVIAAHRNIYGSYFYRLDELLPGTKIILRTPDQKFRYQVVQSFQVADTQGAIVKAAPPNSPPLLTLYTCTIPRSTNRLVVTAQLLPDDAP